MIDNDEEEMINRYQRRRPRRRIDIEHLNQDLEEFQRLNFIDSVPNDRRIHNNVMYNKIEVMMNHQMNNKTEAEFLGIIVMAMQMTNMKSHLMGCLMKTIIG